MKKMVLGAILVLLITIGGGVYYLLSNLDGLVKSAIETYGSQATHTAVRVDAVKIGLKDGSGAILGLKVANPAGFSAAQAFSLGEISTQVDLKALSEDLVVIDHIRVIAPDIFFELNQAGQNNLEQLKKNLSSGGTDSSTLSPNTQTRESEMRLLIREILFTGGKIHASVVPLGKKYELQLPTISLKNIGGKNGATPSQITAQVVKALSDRALAEIKKQGIDQYRKKLEGKVNKRLNAEQQKLEQKLNDKVGKEVGGQVGDALKGLFNKQ
ncbi:MAG: AsmA family protein [Geopsychrobacter sp.]|nr:AsmA family protein [Geopsychrobacter sp.]